MFGSLVWSLNKLGVVCLFIQVYLFKFINCSQQKEIKSICLFPHEDLFCLEKVRRKKPLTYTNQTISFNKQNNTTTTSTSTTTKQRSNKTKHSQAVFASLIPEITDLVGRPNVYMGCYQINSVKKYVTLGFVQESEPDRLD